MASAKASEMLGSAVVDELVGRISSVLEERYKLQSDAQGKLQRLKELLTSVECIVEAASGKEIKNEKLANWLKDLIGAVKEAGDLMSSIESQRTERVRAPSSSNVFKRICTATYRTAINVLLPREDDVKLSNLVQRLERITPQAESLVQLLNFEAEPNKPIVPTTALPTNLDTFFGREKEQKDIIAFLLSKDPPNVRNVQVLAIFGDEGIGKTTLAQIVYNDEEVCRHFSLRMWVCASQGFDPERLTKEILEHMDSQTGCGGVVNFNRLQGTLMEKLSKETFLLIIDDVQNGTGKDLWDKLKAPLNCGKEGSKILLTSRVEKVAKLMGTTNPIKLEGLPEEEYWSLFKECAFGEAKLEEHPRLEAIGKDIVSELKGSPLAAKTVSAMLKGNLDVDHWERKKRELEFNQNGMA